MTEHQDENDYATSLAESIAEHAVLWGEDDEGNEVPMGFDVNVLRTLVDAAVKGSVSRALDDVDQRLAARINAGPHNSGVLREPSYLAGFLDALESARHEVRWKRPDVTIPPVGGAE